MTAMADLHEESAYPGTEAPNTKIQDPGKHQAPTATEFWLTEHLAGRCGWSFEVGASLELGSWCLDLFFGIEIR
jgi:hypothetical protein